MKTVKMTWQKTLRKALQAEGYLINGKIYSDKRNDGRRYKFNVAKQGAQVFEIANMTNAEKNRVHQIVIDTVLNAKRYGGDSILTYVLFTTN